MLEARDIQTTDTSGGTWFIRGGLRGERLIVSIFTKSHNEMMFPALDVIAMSALRRGKVGNFFYNSGDYRQYFVEVKTRQKVPEDA